jgi:hypothetical protein
MWKSRTINGYEISIKCYETGSESGINGGKISKLEIKKSGKIVVSYERGWYIEPGKDAIEIYNQIISEYN